MSKTLVSAAGRRLQKILGESVTCKGVAGWGSVVRVYSSFALAS